MAFLFLKGIVVVVDVFVYLLRLMGRRMPVFRITCAALPALFSRAEEPRDSSIIHSPPLRGGRRRCLSFRLRVLQCLRIVATHEKAADAFVALHAFFETTDAQTKIRTWPRSPIDNDLRQEALCQLK